MRPNTCRIRTASLVLSIILLQGMALPTMAQEDDLCLFCHTDAGNFTGLENAEQLVVTADQVGGSIHGMLGLRCVDCHMDLMGSEEIPHASPLQPVECGMCHYDVMETFEQSYHGYARERGNDRAPTCASCHGTHEILSSTDPESPTHRLHLTDTCAGCHGTEGLLTDRYLQLRMTVEQYHQSVHGNGDPTEDRGTAGCADCHGVHDLKGHADPDSRIHKTNVASTCGECHGEAQIYYERSIHGRALQAGIWDSPTCNDCHGEHLILSPSDEEASTYGSRLATETCGTCHDDPVIIAEYRMTEGVVGSYSDSYHGWAAQRGSENAATCVSCHSAHFVLPAADPLSPIHIDNVAATCAACHEGADLNFAMSYTHAATSITTNPINRTIRTIYIFLIIAVIGGMVLHNILIINYHIFERRRKLKDASWIRRLDTTEVIQHLLLAASFILLVITGFALRFPETGWARFVTWLGMNEPVRGTIHRAAAVLMIGVSFHHLYSLIFTPRGRMQLRAMLPGFRDASDAIGAVRFYTWMSRKQPGADRYDYTQKAEYWALIWGTAVMALTGFVLWFPEQAVKVFPSWIVMVSQTIHYYEAWLATLAIIVWHGFFTLVHPREFPMSWTWITGRMPLEDARHHHSRWYEDVVTGREKEELLDLESAEETAAEDSMETTGEAESAETDSTDSEESSEKS